MVSLSFIISFWFIYIPIWIDLKGSAVKEALQDGENLHSNMDRFESKKEYSWDDIKYWFTFQYG